MNVFHPDYRRTDNLRHAAAVGREDAQDAVDFDVAPSSSRYGWSAAERAAYDAAYARRMRRARLTLARRSVGGAK